MQVFLLQPDSVKVLISLSLHFPSHSLVSMVLSHFFISFGSVLFIHYLLGFNRLVFAIVDLNCQSMLVLSMTACFVSVLKDLDIGCVTGSTVSVISGLGGEEFFVLSDFIAFGLLCKVS